MAIKSLGTRNGAMASAETLTGNLEFFTMFTKLNIEATNDYADATQKDFESIIQVIALRSMPVIMNTPVELDGTGSNTLENYGAPTLTGSGYILKISFEHTGAHTVETLKQELNGIVLNAGTVDTLNVVNLEFTKQDLL
jgi:hypothetical protein